MNIAVDNSSFQPTLSVGASRLKQVCWYFTNRCFFLAGWNISSTLKVFLLRLFGARVGHKVVIKPGLNIKYPWKLRIGNHTWLGECIWIDNLAEVSIGDHVTVSQGALLLTGNHNYRKSTFDLTVAPIVLEDGVWIGAKSVVCPGVTCASHSILTVGSIATKNLSEYTIYQGNPAQPVKKREIQ